MAANAVAAAPTADAEGHPAQPDPGELRLAEAPTPLTNEPTAPNSDVRIAQLTEKLAKLMTQTLSRKCVVRGKPPERRYSAPLSQTSTLIPDACGTSAVHRGAPPEVHRECYTDPNECYTDPRVLHRSK